MTASFFSFICLMAMMSAFSIGLIALAGWVDHFLLGLGVTQPKLDKVTGETGEAIDGILRNIAQLGYDEDEDQEELEMSLEEIIDTFVLPRCYATTPLLIRNRPRQKYKNRLYTKNKKRKESVMSEISRQD